MASTTSLKRSWTGPSPPLPPTLTPWEHHLDYGIVHPSGCAICRSYMDHLAEASYSTTQPSFQSALEARNHRRDDDYYDGIAEGRRRQKADDRTSWEDLKRYRVERDVAKEEIEDVRAELEIARGALEKWKAECERLGTAQHHSGTQAQMVPLNEILTLNGGVASNATPGPASLRILPKLNGDAVPFPKPLTSYAAVASAQLPSPPSSANPSRQASSPTSQLPAAASSSLPAVIALGSGSAPGSANTSASLMPASTLSRLKHIRELQTLCNSAHQPGNTAALARVKALCTAAHATPKERKTDAQRWLLSNWRSPAWERAAAAAAGLAESNNGAPPIVSTSSASFPALNGNANGSGMGLTMQPPRLDSPIETWVAYLTVHPTSWPRGVRKDAFGQPVYADVKASRIVARLRPASSNGNGGTATPATNASHSSTATPVNARNSFTSLAVTLFADPVLYGSLLTKHGIEVAKEAQYLRYEHNEGEGEIKLLDLVRHFASCGITVGVGMEMGGWAREYQKSAIVSA